MIVITATVLIIIIRMLIVITGVLIVITGLLVVFIGTLILADITRMNESGVLIFPVIIKTGPCLLGNVAQERTASHRDCTQWLGQPLFSVESLA